MLAHAVSVINDVFGEFGENSDVSATDEVKHIIS